MHVIELEVVARLTTNKLFRQLSRVVGVVCRYRVFIVSSYLLMVIRLLPHISIIEIHALGQNVLHNALFLSSLCMPALLLVIGPPLCSSHRAAPQFNCLDE